MRDDLAQQARIWAKASCAAQGLAAKVKDPIVLGQVVVLLANGPTAPVGHAVGRDRSLASSPPGRRAA